MGQDTALIQMVCGICGSDAVIRDAWAEWNVAAQGWGLGAVFEHAFCHRCQAATRVVEAAAGEAGAGAGPDAGSSSRAEGERTDP